MKHLHFSHAGRESGRPRTLGLTALVATVALVSACSTGAWYEGIKISAQSECERQAPSAREDCLSRLNNKSYDTYEKERVPTTQ